MNKIINLIVCISTILALSSCNSSQEANPDATSSNGSSLKLENRITALEREVNSLTIGISLVTLFSLSLIIALFWKTKESKEELLYSNRRITKLKEEFSVFLRNNNDFVQDVKTRLSEQQSKQGTADVDKKATTSQPPTPTCGENPDAPRESESYGVGYAKNDANVYFMKIYDSNQEGCVFKIDFTSPTKGTFDIISLDKIRSRNDWQQKVVCRGDSIKDASGYCIEDEGICEKIDNNAWKVTKPLKIKLFK